MIEQLVMAAVMATGPSRPHEPPPLTVSKTSSIMVGPKLPYRGKYWRPSQRKFTLCVLSRESNNNWFSTNRAAGYFGGFQFSKPLTRGATYMITTELQQLFGKKRGKQIAKRLRGIEMQKWHPWYQHVAFATVLNWEHDWSGKSHWHGGRWSC